MPTLHPKNNAYYIKYKTHTSQQLRRYTFLRVRLRNQRFLPHPQKTGRRYGCVFNFIQNNSRKGPQKIRSLLPAVCVSQNVTASTVGPAAYFCVCGICIANNNVRFLTSITPQTKNRMHFCTRSLIYFFSAFTNNIFKFFCTHKKNILKIQPFTICSNRSILHFLFSQIF